MVYLLQDMRKHYAGKQILERAWYWTVLNSLEIQKNFHHL